MGNLVQILGESKFSGSTNEDIIKPLLIEGSNKKRFDQELNRLVSSQDVFNNEKVNSKKFRIYGTINPIINNNIVKKTINGLTKIDINKNKLKLNNDNWVIALLKSNQIRTNNLNFKGYKNITWNNLSLDLSDGLPAKIFYSKDINNFGILFLLKHNLSVGDKVFIKSSSDKLATDLYTIIRINGNVIYINHPAIIINKNNQTTVESNIQEEVLSFFDVSGENTNPISNNSNIVNYVDVSVMEDNTVNPFHKVDFMISKIKEREKLQYYIKTLEVIDVIDSVDDIQMATNFYNKKIGKYIFNNDLNIENMINNLNHPLTDIFIGVFKKNNGINNHICDFEFFANKSGKFSGIKNITNKTFSVGDIMLHSICEYSQDNLEEIELDYIHHKFSIDDITFNYNPYSKIQLKMLGNILTDTVDENVPKYSFYNSRDGNYMWRNILDIGEYDDNGLVLNYPFLNGCHYIYKPVTFFLKVNLNNTPKFDLGLNDLNSNLVDININPFNDYMDVLNLSINDILNDITQDPEINPFINYNDEIC